MSLPILNYRLLRESRRNKWVVLILCIGISAGVWFYRISIETRLEISVAIWRCQRYSLPQEQIVYDEGSSSSQKLIAQGRTFSFRSSGPAQGAAELQCIPWQNLHLPRECYSDSPVFLHELTSPNGHRRLVAVFMTPGSECFGFCVVKASVFSEPEVLHRHHGFNIIYPSLNRTDDSPLQLHAGQTDMNDMSHFTIAYDCPNGSGVVDGWLRDEDYVVFRTLSGPLKLPLQWFENCEKVH